VTTAPPTNLLGLNRQRLETFFQELGEARFRAEQVLKWVHQHRVRDFESMTNLSKALRERLSSCAEVRLPEIVSEQVSADGTRKWLLRVDAHNCVETVFIPEEGRGTLCVSSQVGCALNCAFCATAKQGFSRDLTVAEIIAQVWIAKDVLEGARGKHRTITNVVMMGMGEPLLNFDAVVEAMDLMQEDCAYGLARRRITVSTAGVVPAIDQLRERCPVSLAVSLHAPNDELRSRLVPLNRKYPIAKLLAACRRYVEREPKHQVTIEYALLRGVNDSSALARELARLLRGLPAKINLIPVNPIAGEEFETPHQSVIDAFREILTAAGFVTITRKTRGADIDAACGQLAGRVQRRGRLPKKSPNSAGLQRADQAGHRIAAP